MSTSNILLIRHGSTGLYAPEQKPEDGLSDYGRKEVKALSEFLERYSIEAFYSSPYQRARDSAEILAGKKPVRVDSRLREIPLWTTPSELSEDETRLEMTKILVEAQEGIEKILVDVQEHYPKGSVAFVCHGNIIRATLAFALEMSLESAVRLSTATAALTVLEFTPNGYYILKLYNSRPYTIDE